MRAHLRASRPVFDPTEVAQLNEGVRGGGGGGSGSSGSSSGSSSVSSSGSSDCSDCSVSSVSSTGSAGSAGSEGSTGSAGATRKKRGGTGNTKAKARTSAAAAAAPVAFSMPAGGKPLLWKVPRSQTAKRGHHAQRALCYVDPGKVEVAFQRSEAYVGEWGANPRGKAALQESRARYAAAAEFIGSGQRILVSIAELNGQGSVRFIDGKHRFCVYRDMGLKTIPLLVPQAQRATFERLFGVTRTAKKAAKRGVRTVKRAVFDSAVPMW